MLINKQMAIDALAKEMPRLTTPDGSGQFDREIQIADEAFVDCMTIINELPVIDIPRWIPCSERLPDGRTEVNVSCHDDSGDTPFDYTSCGWMTTDKEYWIVDNEINNFVVAWMPLPKPYKESDK